MRRAKSSERSGYIAADPIESGVYPGSAVYPFRLEHDHVPLLSKRIEHGAVLYAVRLAGLTRAPNLVRRWPDVEANGCALLLLILTVTLALLPQSYCVLYRFPDEE
jgi:hypothetical protein